MNDMVTIVSIAVLLLFLVHGINENANVQMVDDWGFLNRWHVITGITALVFSFAFLIIGLLIINELKKSFGTFHQ